MLNIGKLAAGGEAYYLDTVASGVEDYYTGAGEAPGYWLTEAAAELGLSGRVDADDLRAVLAATDPGSGQRLVSARSRRAVPGFDLAFRAPKSVSLLYGLGDAATAEAVRAAHDAAVDAAVGWLEAEAARSRRGHGGSERVAVTGLVAAAFRHRSSRARDPLLHTHVLVANLAQAVDDRRWRTLDTAALYTHAKTAGYLYQAQLRHELTRALGVEWTPVRHGYADVAGIPRDVIDAFSQRRHQILQRLAVRGESSAKAAQAATLDTRAAKPPGQGSSEPALRDEWQRRGRGLGFAAEQVAALLPAGPDHPKVLPDAERVSRWLLGPEGLTGQASSFTRRDALRGCCEQLPAGAPVAHVTALTDTLLADGDALVRIDTPTLTTQDTIRRADDRIVPAAADEPRYSTVELLMCEQRLIAAATSRRSAGVATVRSDLVDAALARRPTIGDDQAAMVRRLLTGGAGVDVVVGPAGTGKTFALDAARQAWQDAGHRVIGAALAARAAAELRDGAGIPSVTVTQLLADLARPVAQGGGLSPGTVLVIDEAAMIGTRQLAALLDAAAVADAKVVLVGDHHQLPEIDAGGAFAGLVNRLPVIELTANRRQHDPLDRQALHELRDGDPHTTVQTLDAGGRIITADTAEAAREALVGDWFTAHAEHGDDGVMIAARRSDVDDLNSRARHRMLAAGELQGDPLIAGGRAFAVDDQVVATANRWLRDSDGQRVRLRNGDRGHVTTIDHDRRQLHIAVAGRTVVVPAGYLDDSHLAHGYAVTAHKAQGATVERSWVLGTDALYREWGYTALSRHRHSTRLYIVAGNDTDETACDIHHQQGNAPQPRGVPTQLAGRLARSHAKQLATDHTDNIAPPPPRSPAPSTAATPHAAARELQRLDQERQRAAQQLERARRLASQAATDAHNRRGRLPRLTRQRHTATATAPAVRAVQDVSRWQQRLDDLDARHRHLSQHTDALDASTGDPAGSDAVVPELELRARLRRLERDSSAYLDAALGPRPAGLAAPGLWRAAAIQRDRGSCGAADPEDALGPLPAQPRQRAAHDAAQPVVARTARVAGQSANDVDLDTATELA